MVEPFDKWDLEFIWPINPPSKQKDYILVFIDYMSKWVEAIDLVKSTDQSIIDFLYGDIFIRFGVPREIVTNGGRKFVSCKMEDLFQKYDIQHRIASPYHPQQMAWWKGKIR